MMKKTKSIMKKVGSIMSMAVVMSVCLTGCGGNSPGSQKVQHAAIIMSNTKNEGTIDTSSLMSNMIELASSGGSTVSYFNCDGNPEYMDTLTIPEYKDGLSDNKIKQLSEGYASQIVNALSGLTPNDTELDLFRAISLAARQLQEYEGDKTLYIASSGLSTSGLVDFTELYLEKDHSEELTKALENELPDLTGVKIVWFGLGETYGAQSDLYESNRKILENTWRNILISSGVDDKEVSFSKALSVNKDRDIKNLPDVSLVPISCTVADVASNKDLIVPVENDSDMKEEKKNTLIDLNDSVKFKADSTELLTSRNELVASLSMIIDYLREDSNHQILLVGTTASCGEEESLREFSMKRCETIKNVLLEEGVSYAQVQCVGAGYDNNLTINDRSENGDLIEDLAKQNRKVYLFTNAKSEEAQKILEKFS